MSANRYDGMVAFYVAVGVKHLRMHATPPLIVLLQFIAAGNGFNLLKLSGYLLSGFGGLNRLSGSIRFPFNRLKPEKKRVKKENFTTILLCFQKLVETVFFLKVLTSS